MAVVCQDRCASLPPGVQLKISSTLDLLSLDFVQSLAHTRRMSENDNPQNRKPDDRQKRLGELERLERDVERRLVALENSVSEIRKSHLDGHKWFVTIFFGLVGIFLSYTANQSKNDVREDLRNVYTQVRDSMTDMRQKVNESTVQQQATVDKAVAQMNQNFKDLAGEALKKPQLTLANMNGPLDGQTLTLNQPRQIPLFPLFITNEGDKRSGTISIRLFSSDDLNLQNGGAFQRVDINNKDYPYCYYLSIGEITGATLDLAPAETWTIPNMLQYSFIPLGTNHFINCKLDIYYDSGPAEAKFRIKSY